MDPESPTVDPFSIYGIDSDSIPQRSENDSSYERREVPPDAWDPFVLNLVDQQDLSPDNTAAVRGHLSSHFPRLPNRLACLGMWIADVANHPACVWWAARQKSLHPDYRRRIEQKLSRVDHEIDGDLLKLWEYILEAWNTSAGDSRREGYDLKRNIQSAPSCKTIGSTYPTANALMDSPAA